MGGAASPEEELMVRLSRDANPCGDDLTGRREISSPRCGEQAAVYRIVNTSPARAASTDLEFTSISSGKKWISSALLESFTPDDRRSGLVADDPRNRLQVAEGQDWKFTSIGRALPHLYASQ